MTPSGRTSRLRVFIDPDLLPFDEVWAAAGRRHGAFGIEPTRWWEPANSW